MIDQGELFSIPNPCRGICQVNNKGYCKGCLRSRKERFHWQEFTPFQQQLVINACEKRRQRIIAARETIADEEIASEVFETNTPQLALVLNDDMASVEGMPDIQLANDNNQLIPHNTSNGVTENGATGNETSNHEVIDQAGTQEGVTKGKSTKEEMTKEVTDKSESKDDPKQSLTKNQQQQDLFG